MNYDCLYNKFLADCGSPNFNLPPITIDDTPHLHKRARYTPDMLPYTISVASVNSVSTLTTSYDSPKTLLLTSDDPNTLHAMNKYDTYNYRVHKGY